MAGDRQDFAPETLASLKAKNTSPNGMTFAFLSCDEAAVAVSCHMER
jgi:hypothetical protein